MYVRQWGSQYKLDADALEQVSRLLGFAVGSQTIINVVLLIMSTIIGIAVALSVKTFVSSNEHFLCIMRAFGYKRWHLILLFLLEFLVITLIAMVFFILLGLLPFHCQSAAYLVETFAIDAQWASFKTTYFLLSVTMSYLFTSIIGLVVLETWWRNNRYVGNKLQGL